jgi:uncharacterized membrane protein YjjB (DUF3815 family)
MYLFIFEGGGRLKFGDVVMAVATGVVIMVLLAFLLDLVLVQAMGYYWGLNVGAIISVFVGALISGYVFAGQIWEARMKAIAQITVLAAVFMMFTVVAEVAALGDWTQMVHEAYLDANPGAHPSTSDWYAVESMVLGSQVALNVVIVLVLGFIGLYVGSMLKRPAKS